MNCRKAFLSIMALTVVLAATGGSAMTVDEAVEKLMAHKFGQNDDVLNFRPGPAK